MTDAQFAECAPMVRYAARRLMCAKALPSSIERDDLEQAGTMGLLDAESRFDAGRGVTLKAFASRRVHGAMVDYLRTEAPQSRAQYAKAKAGETVGVFVVDLEHARELPAPSVDLDARILSHQITAALASLDTRDRYIINQHFFKDLSLSDVGKTIGLSHGRVSQLLARALRQLRAAASAQKPATEIVAPRASRPSSIAQRRVAPVLSGMMPRDQTPWRLDGERALRAKALKGHVFKPSTLP